MSKQNSAVERKGFSTPENVAQPGQAGKTLSLGLRLALEDDIVPALDAASVHLFRLAYLFDAINKTAARAVADTKNEYALRHGMTAIQHLAEIGEYVCNDIGNFVDCEHEKARDEHVPAIIAALGGEA